MSEGRISVSQTFISRQQSSCREALLFSFQNAKKENNAKNHCYYAGRAAERGYENVD
jgi:hypothetical protein